MKYRNIIKIALMSILVLVGAFACITALSRGVRNDRQYADAPRVKSYITVYDCNGDCKVAGVIFDKPVSPSQLPTMNRCCDNIE